MQYIFHLPSEYSFEKVGIKGKIFNTKNLSGEVEFSIIETKKGHETKIIEKECIFSYYILEGSGIFEIDGQKDQCGESDLVVIPKGIPFQYSGTMKMLLISVPWWFPEQEVTL
jgi:mannose-6-phosphate isomerase-like protein (cupin superfamily)